MNRGRAIHKVLLPLLLASLLWQPATASARSYSLRKIIQRTLAKRTTTLSLARYLGTRQRKAAKVTFTREEQLDQRHPALSVLKELPRADWPHSAVLRTSGRVLGIPMELRIVTERAALEDAARRKTLLTSPKTTLVLLLSVKSNKRDTGITPQQVKRVMRRLGVNVSMIGSVSNCDAETAWCHLQVYHVRRQRRRSSGSVHLELSHPPGEKRSRVRAIKILRPAVKKKTAGRK